MNTDSLKKLLTSLKETDVEELEYEAGDTKVFFRKSNVKAAGVSQAAQVQAAPVEQAKKMVSIKSNMVGTFHQADKTNRPPFVMEGNHVVPGKKVGVIEAMKIMKDVTSNVKGKIVNVLVKDGQPVEYGQELFTIDPNDVKEEDDK
jgi:biotin carboxyl carrier protein